MQETLSKGNLDELRMQSALPERIIIMIDLCSEMLSEFGDSLSRLDALKKALEMLLWRKCASVFKHEYSLITFNSDGGMNSHDSLGNNSSPISIVSPFTKNFDTIKDAVCSLTVSTAEHQFSGNIDDENYEYNLSDLFSHPIIRKLINSSDSCSLFPTDTKCITRIIFIYANSFKVIIHIVF